MKGLLLWAIVLCRRLHSCSMQLRLHNRPLHRQAGSCDLPDADIGGCDASCGDALDVADCSVSVGDCWPGARRDIKPSAGVEEKVREYERRHRAREGKQ